MSSSQQILGIVFVAGALILALSALRSHRLNLGQTVRMAAIWVAIIVGLAVLLSVIGV